ncbi:DMT family transporter [Caldilinea sp.]|uniref:DMT family transporter n=1 Tax=Caldilinea sp. TaxID=2293560 RepID=UPI0021DB9494|nr:SMR family transporter [Caldilinea sp.]GIV70185.1 MAG: multidrug transporter [Caldilinea sp.]
MKAWLLLMGAIIAEVTATTALRASDGLSRLGPTLIVIVGYSISFYLLSLTLRTIPIGIAYAIWSGIGLVLITLSARFFFGQELDAPALIGMGLILAGVVIMNLFSRSIPH